MPDEFAPPAYPRYYDYEWPVRWMKEDGLPERFIDGRWEAYYGIARLSMEGVLVSEDEFGELVERARAEWESAYRYFRSEGALIRRKGDGPLEIFGGRRWLPYTDEKAWKDYFFKCVPITEAEAREMTGR